MFEFMRNTVYARISPEFVSVLQVESGREYGDVPLLAVEERGGKRAIVAAGRATQNSASTVTLVNAFLHPRTPIADFTMAEQTLRYFLKQVLSGRLFVPSPVVVLHPLGDFEGGLTQIEIRALAELGMGVGARRVYVWQGPELSREELSRLQFTRTGGRLLHP